ncbi:hybrid sensor histidine kinase/response regulator [Phormidium sp. CCY1219]|uniref:hybrid sensor histidine kinase/response regulator n=1 Tax=Phormidium sp. CCY1219 TaxID=2886104 RepID=UPI002D1EA97E|nr:ATP-binding protein [Phormidium sp. CCY1219]MEB3828837.1 response regulator [Phormidium sp. CCY1219]
MSWFQTVKGCFYVAITAVILYQLIRYYVAALQASKENLQSNQERLRAIIETNAEGILVFDRQGYITLANRAAEKHLGLRRSQIIGRPYRDPIWQLHRLDPPGFPVNELPFCPVMESRKGLCDMEYAIAHSNGTQLFLSINAAPLLDPTRKIDGVVLSISDITHRKETEAIARARDIAEARNRAKSEFLAHMSHEIRTPLNSILGLSQMLQREIFGTLNPKQKEYVSRIKTSGDHLLELINDILDLSKIEAGKEELQLKEVPVAELCHYCLKIIQERASERGLQLTTHIDPQAKICIADERRLKQMLLNLLSNAIKFTPKGTVSLIVAKKPEGIEFTVADTGIGVSPEQLPLVFEAFRQIENELNQKTKGTGLGLALTRDFAHLHGGELSAQSTPGQGSEFTIYLPDLPPGYTPTSANDSLSLPETSPVCPSKRRILIVDYDESNTILLRDYLDAMGHRVKIIGYGSDFLDRVYSFNPHLILLDLQLANPVTGLELVSQLRQEEPLQSLPVVVVTAMAMSGDRDRCLAAGATDYLSKPFQLEELDKLLLHYTQS